MSRDERNLPATGNGRTPGQKPRMKETFVRDGKGNVNWDDTTKSFPLDKELKRDTSRIKAAKRLKKEGRG